MQLIKLKWFFSKIKSKYCSDDGNICIGKIRCGNVFFPEKLWLILKFRNKCFRHHFFFFEKEFCFDNMLSFGSKNEAVIMQGTWFYSMRSRCGLVPNDKKCHYDRKITEERVLNDFTTIIEMFHNYCIDFKNRQCINLKDGCIQMEIVWRFFWITFFPIINLWCPL